MNKIILASSSPRRIEMMKNNGYDPLIMPADVNETLPFDMSPEAAVMYLAFKKASYIDATVCDEHIIIAADTVVVYDNKIIGKPIDKNDAFDILGKLRSNYHYVITGVSIIDTYNSKKLCFYDKTTVFFKNYSDDELNAYLDTPEAYDKAGGYAIQQTFGKYVDHIEGDFDNVVGFPWYRVKQFLEHINKA